MAEPLSPSSKHPVSEAVRLNAAFTNGRLVKHPLKKSFRPVCATLETLYFGKMPWRVRFFALFTGRIPFSYLEESEDGTQ